MFTDIEKLEKNPQFKQRSKEEKIKEELELIVEHDRNKVPERVFSVVDSVSRIALCMLIILLEYYMTKLKC